jgi:hypothetical protein
MYSNRIKKVRTKRLKADCPKGENSLTFSKGYKGKFGSSHFLSLLVILLLVLSILVHFPQSRAVEPSVPIDLGSEIFTTSWPFDAPEFYNYTDVEFSDGRVGLVLNSYLWDQTSDDDFKEGELDDSLAITRPTTTRPIWEDDFDADDTPPPWDTEGIDDSIDEWQKTDISNIPVFMGSSPSGENVWATNPGGKYTDNELSNYYLRSPNIDLSKYEGTRLTLSFHHYYIFDNDISGNDGGIVEISVDDGDSWELIFPKRGYSAAIDDPNNRIYNLDPQNKFFGGDSLGWITDEFILDKYDEETDFSFRFRFATNGQDSDYGWYIDDVVINSTTVSEGEIELASETIDGGNSPDNAIQRQAGITIIDVRDPINHDGILTQWSVHVNTDGSGRMRIFREVGDNFVFVAQTIIEDVFRNLTNNFDCNIEVEAGDYIGWYGETSEIFAREILGSADSYFIDGNIFQATPKSQWTLTNLSHSIEASGLFREPDGTYTSQVFDAGSKAIWEEISWIERIPNSDVDIEFRTRSGDVKDPTQGWNDWTSEISIPTGITIESPPSRYFQFWAELISDLQPHTPVLDNITVKYSKYFPVGRVETEDFMPGNVVQWLDFSTTDTTSSGQTINYSYSLDSGDSWTRVENGDLRSVSVLGGKIRFRMDFFTTDTTLTPELDEISITYSTAQPLMSMRLEVDNKQAVSQDEITFRIFYSNTGTGNAKDVRIELVLDDSLIYESSFESDDPDDSNVDGNKIIWQYDIVEPTGGGENVIRIVSSVKNIEDETSFNVTALLNYTDSGGNIYPGIESNSIDIDIAPALDVFYVLLVGIFLAFITAIIMIVVTRRVLREEPEDRIAMGAIGRGIGYLVIEDNPKKSYGVFSELIDSGKQGLCITRTFPGRIMSNYSFDNVSLLWLSRARDQNSILPTNLGGVLRSVKDFIEENEDSVVLLDGLEYLIVHNDFERVLKLVHGMNELVAINDARLIIPFNPLTMDEDKVALLKRDLKLIT